jgi:hypothetical protein
MFQSDSPTSANAIVFATGCDEVLTGLGLLDTPEPGMRGSFTRPFSMREE